MTQEPKLIVVSLDALSPYALSCFGSSWNQTPTIDALAANGCVWDRCIAAHTDPLMNLKQWFGVHETLENESEHWIDWWQRTGPVELLSDNHDVINLAAKSRFDQLYLIETDGEDSDQNPADEIESTQFAQLIAAATERVHESDPWGVMWLHSSCLAKRWDAPRWLAPPDDLDDYDEPIDESEYVEELPEDAEPFESLPATFDQVKPPHLQLTQDAHPDLIATWMRTYGCQLRLIDELLGVLRAAVADIELNIVIAGSSGFSLGQNGWIGHRCGPLRSCHLHLPIVIDQIGPLRCPQLMDAANLPNLIGRLHRENTDNVINPETWAQSNQESTIVSRAENDLVSVTTPNWFYSDDEGDVDSFEERKERLFLKPDDIHDVNDVSRLRPDVVDQLRSEVQ